MASSLYQYSSFCSRLEDKLRHSPSSNETSSMGIIAMSSSLWPLEQKCMCVRLCMCVYGSVHVCTRLYVCVRILCVYMCMFVPLCV